MEKPAAEKRRESAAWTHMEGMQSRIFHSLRFRGDFPSARRSASIDQSALAKPALNNNHGNDNRCNGCDKDNTITIRLSRPSEKIETRFRVFYPAT